MDKKREDKNKVDLVIDEVMESKRLRQGFGFLFKTAAGLLVLAFIIFIVAVATGIIS